MIWSFINTSVLCLVSSFVGVASPTQDDCSSSCLSEPAKATHVVPHYDDEVHARLGTCMALTEAENA
ncbi:hypothetical protein PGT21_008490 [Puccinia graminis f. sp. tritici]|uniref:Secreted protein n=1 Tax=Puccinia graminis f. sp. tritici TaxID=56615 RepID=A0A5B0QAB1_PUCGR|nr:hypothetical protein PGT21_008490 [Puccinia graminis f. sp. tritici]